jgi:hypothetical protein
MALLVLLLIAVTASRVGLIVTVPTDLVGANLSFATEVGQDGLFSHGVLGGYVQQLPRPSRGLALKRVDECLAGGAAGEGIDDVRVPNVGEFVALLGEELDVFLEDLA